jgi:uncharacterized protein YbcV (DUF1398 family)
MKTPPFTVQQIKSVHAKVKSGADFPNYIREIIQLGVIGFEIFVSDSHTSYFGKDGYQTSSLPQYHTLIIADKSNTPLFISYLKTHQQGGSDYLTFCRQCAEMGIEKWVVDTAAMTCIYYDKTGKEILVETIPSMAT